VGIRHKGVARALPKFQSFVLKALFRSHVFQYCCVGMHDQLRNERNWCDEAKRDVEVQDGLEHLSRILE
jgi:hypothetical protein